MTNRFIALCLLFLACLPSIDLLNERAQAAVKSPNDILVVANKSVTSSSITVGELRSIFLKQKKHWNSGDKAIPVHAKVGTRLRSAFIRAILEMDIREEHDYWEAQRVRYALSPPPEFNNILKAVFHLRGSVSYIFRKDFKEGVVDVLLVIPASQ